MNGLHRVPVHHRRRPPCRDPLDHREKWSIMSVESATTGAIRSAAAQFDAVTETTTTYVRALTAEAAARRDAELDVRAVTSRAVATDFEEVLGEAFGAGRSLGAPFVDDAVLASVGVKAVVAYRRGVPVATGMSIRDDLGFLGVFAIGSTPRRDGRDRRGRHSARPRRGAARRRAHGVPAVQRGRPVGLPPTGVRAGVGRDHVLVPVRRPGRTTGRRLTSLTAASPTDGFGLLTRRTARSCRGSRLLRADGALRPLPGPAGPDAA